MKTQLTAFLLAMVASGAALAQTVIPGEQLDAIDTNDDSVVTRAEMTTAMGLAFGALDQDADGFLSFPEAQVTMSRELFDGADANRDQGVSRAEFDAQVDRDFQAADEDQDGMLN